MLIKPTKIKMCMYSTLVRLKNMTMYERVKGLSEPIGLFRLQACQSLEELSGCRFV